MVGLGLGEIVGSNVFGYVQDHCSNKASAFFCLVLTVGGIGVCFSYVIHFTFSMGFGVAMTFIWGI
jgi:predicted MFS family arabinose efflux permease